MIWKSRSDPATGAGDHKDDVAQGAGTDPAKAGARERVLGHDSDGTRANADSVGSRTNAHPDASRTNMDSDGSRTSRILPIAPRRQLASAAHCLRYSLGGTP
jgi:hypothetical protein